MKKIWVLSLLLITSFSAQSQTKSETEKWLAEKLYAFGDAIPEDFTQYRIDVNKIEVLDCKILVSMYCFGSNSTFIETIPIEASFTHDVRNLPDGYVFKGKILNKGTYGVKGSNGLFTGQKREFNSERSSSYFILYATNDMLERIQKALEHYRKLCGVNEPF